MRQAVLDVHLAEAASVADSVQGRHRDRTGGDAWLRWNGACNRLFYRLTRRPHHFELYKRLVREGAARSTYIVHLGAGSVWLGDLCTDLAGKTVYAVDPDAEALATNLAPRKLVARGEKIPLPSASVDTIVCEYVAEHLEHPEEVLREVHRLLRPGGSFIFVTPNLLSYVGLVTHLTPHWLHVRFLRALLRVGGSGNERPYPTAFRMNTLWAVRRLARETGFRVRELHTGVDHPTYTYLFPVIHQLAVLWHVLLDKVEWLAPFRPTLIGVLEKSGDSHADRRQIPRLARRALDGDRPASASLHRLRRRRANTDRGERVSRAAVRDQSRS